MGAILSAGKSEYFWRLLSYLQDSKVYVNDRRLVPYTPARLSDYVDFYPTQYTSYPPTTLAIYVNGRVAAYSRLNQPSGLMLARIQVPLGDFTVQVQTLGGSILKTEYFTAKNYAMFLEVAAQSYADRRVGIEQVLNDLDFKTMRSDRVYQDVGVFFGFTPPPGWSNQDYRDTVLGNGTTKPGFVSSFFNGGTIRGFVDTIRSITGSTVVLESIAEGDRWVVFDRANAPVPTDPTNPDSWFVSSADDIPPPNHRCLVFDKQYLGSALVAVISGADRSVVAENVFKARNSFIQSSLAGPFVLAGKTLTFSIDATSYTTTFGGSTTTAAQAVADILSQNPTLTSACYANNGYVRIGVQPILTQTKAQPIKITIVSGSALADLGFVVGQFVEVSWDQLANPNLTADPVTVTQGSIAYIEGLDFTLDRVTGRIYFQASSVAFPVVPEQGSVFNVSYNYLMRREIETMAELAKDPSITVEYEYI